MKPTNSMRFKILDSLRHLRWPVQPPLVKSSTKARNLLDYHCKSWFSLLVLSSIACGCHPLGSRTETLSDRDDWEAPARSSYAMPRQFQSAYRDRNKASTPGTEQAAAPDANKPSSPQNASKESPKASEPKSKVTDQAAVNSQQPGKPSEPKPTQDTVAKPVTDSSEVPSTGSDDLDLEAAIAVLPPNLQQVLRNQIAATQAKSNDSSATAVASANQAAPIQDHAITQDHAIMPVVQASNVPAPSDNQGVVVAVDHTPVRASLTDRSATLAVSQEPAKAAIAQVPPSPSMPAVAASHGQPSNHNHPTGQINLANTPAPSNLQSSETNSIPSQSPATSPVVTASAEVAVEKELVWDEALAQAARNLEKTLSEQPGMDSRLRVNHELALRMIHLANNDLENALKPIEGLQPAEQEYYRYQLQALADSSNPDASPVASRRWSLVMENQRKANQYLASVSNLEVRNAAFCTDVQGYGAITPFQAKLFKPDQDVLLYCELENVTAEELRNGFETQLQGNYEIVDSRGNRIADQLLPMEKEICANHRRDYFVVYRIFMPVDVSPGNYEMRITIEDLKGKKFGQTMLEFQIQK